MRVAIVKDSVVIQLKSCAVLTHMFAYHQLIAKVRLTSLLIIDSHTSLVTAATFVLIAIVFRVVGAVALVVFSVNPLALISSSG